MTSKPTHSQITRLDAINTAVELYRDGLIPAHSARILLTALDAPAETLSELDTRIEMVKDIPLFDKFARWL
jgi:hypothetical protein